MIFVKKGILACLALLVALHAGFGCSVTGAAAAVETCCGKNCPMCSTVGERACCHTQDPSATSQMISARPSLPTSQPSAVLMPACVILATRSGSQALVFRDATLRAVKLSLLCSRQI